MATRRILDFLATERPEGPCLVVDLEVVAENFRKFTSALPATRIYYAVKANPARPILQRLDRLGASFDTASIYEIELCGGLGIDPGRLAFGSTIKKERDIAAAFARGVGLFAFDSEGELEKLARAAPGARVLCRILMEGRRA